MPHMALVDDYCVTCHDAFEKKGGLALDEINADVSMFGVWRRSSAASSLSDAAVGRKGTADEATYDATIGYSRRR